MTLQRISLTQPIGSRTGSFIKDSRSTNCVFEVRGQAKEFIKRPGLVKATQVIATFPPVVANSQGLVSFNGKIISVINNTVRSTDPTSYVTTTVGSTSATTSRSYFTKTFLDSYLFLHNTLNGYLYSKAGAFGGITNDKITSVGIDNPGVRYSSGITLSFSGGGGVAATATVDSYGSISAVVISNHGSGLSSTPSVTINIPSPVTPTGTGTIALFTIAVSSATGIHTGMTASGTGVAIGARVTTIVGTTITVDVANTATVSGTITFTDAGIDGVLSTTLSDFPTGPFVPGVVFLDNYVFIGVAATNRIYNCALGDPTTWGPLDFLSFEQTADILICIAKHLNYLVAFGSNTIQFYYDNANAVGSPLSVAQAYTNEIGCASGDSVATTDNTVLWIGTSKSHGRSVYLLEGTSPVKVSTPNIDRHLEADSLGKVASYCYKMGGHTLYILTLHNSGKTLVFDINEKMWYQWTQYSIASSDQPNPGTWQETYFRPTYYAEVNKIAYGLDDDTAALYYFDTNTYQDNLQSIYCRVITDLSDNGTTKRKFYGRLEIVGDKVAGVMQIRHTGDDYNTWSSYRTVNLNATRAQVYLSGSDRRRAWEFLCTSNVPLRLEGSEVDFRIGEMDQEQNVGGRG